MARNFRVGIDVLASTKAATTNLASLDRSAGITKNQLLAISAAAIAMGATILVATKKAVNAAAEQQKQEILLAEAMKQAGTFTQQALEHNLAYASSLQRLTAFGDEAIIGVQKMLSNFKIEGEMLDQLTKATLDLASAKGMDLRSAADLVAKSVGSSTNALSRYGIVVEGAVDSTQRAESAIKGITELFGGAAAAEAQTYSGQLQQLNNAIGDLWESVGTLLLPILTDLIKTITPLVTEFTDLIKENKELQAGIESTIESLSSFLKTIVNISKTVKSFSKSTGFLSDVFRDTIKNVKALINPLGTVKKIMVDNSNEVTQVVTENLAKEVEAQEEKNMLEEENMILLHENKKMILDDYAEFVNTKLSEEEEARIAQAERIKNIHLQLTQAMSSSFAQSIKGMIDDGWNFSKVMTTISTAMRDVFINNIAQVAAEWVSKTILMQGATLAWKGITVLANAAVGAAAAAVSAIRSLPFPINIAAAAGAAGATYGLIKGFFADGVRGFGGGLAVVGERGPELVNLPSGSDVLNNAETRNMLTGGNSSGGGGGLIINFTGNTFLGTLEEISDVVAHNIYTDLQLQSNL